MSANLSFRAARVEFAPRYQHAMLEYRQTCEAPTPEMLRRIVRFLVRSPSQATALLSMAKPLRPPPADRFEIFCRKRPIWQHELEVSEFDCVSVEEAAGRCCIHDGKAARDMSTYVLHREFGLDAVFDAHTDESAMLERVLAPLVRLAVCGGAASLILFGQTGCGKTHTARAMQRYLTNALFVAPGSADAAATWTVSLEVFELREKKAYDLLNQRKQVRLVTDADERVHVLGGRTARATSAAELHVVINEAHALRSVAATERNAQSSRSHCVTRLRIEAGGASPAGSVTLVDLAGSERNYETTQHDRLATRESADINMSLQALKECFRATINCDVDLETVVEVGLDDVEWTRAVPEGYKEAREAQKQKEAAAVSTAAAYGSTGVSAVGTMAAVPAALRNFAAGGKKLHSPYRRHQLTLLLKDCFVNPSHRTAVMACTSPTACDVEHSVRTLNQVCQMRGAEEDVSRLVRVECPRTSGEAADTLPMRRWPAERVRSWLVALDNTDLAAAAGLLPEGVDGKELLQRWPASRLAHTCFGGDADLAARLYAEVRAESARVDGALAQRRGRVRGLAGRADDKHGQHARLNDENDDPANSKSATAVDSAELAAEAAIDGDASVELA